MDHSATYDSDNEDGSDCAPIRRSDDRGDIDELILGGGKNLSDGERTCPSPCLDSPSSTGSGADDDAAEEILRAGRQLPDAIDDDAFGDAYSDEEEGGPDLLERQVLARKVHASETVAKLVCDEVDGVDVPGGASEIAPGNLSRSLSRGRTLGGPKGRAGMARSKSIMMGGGGISRSKSLHRTRSIVRGQSRALDGPSDMETKMQQGEGTRRFSRRRGEDNPAPRVIADAYGSSDEPQRRTTAEMLNAMANDSDFEASVPRKQSIRFA